MSRARNPLALLREAYRAQARIEKRLEVLSVAVVRLEAAMRAFAADESGNRRRLEELRASPEYELAWTEPRPLISVTVATIGRSELVERALPSILGQSYGEIEVIVAADGAGAGTEEAVRALGDDRIRFLDLGPRVSWTDDPRKQWLVGATRPRNAAMRAAAGRWVVSFDDDDAMRADCLERLLELARQERAEAPYAQVRSHREEGALEICAYPPRENSFCWAAGMYHAGLRFFERELLAAELNVPGDWWLAERMLRAGVRFAMCDRVLSDIYPSDRRPESL